jgi:hypothetical protein
LIYVKHEGVALAMDVFQPKSKWPCNDLYGKWRMASPHNGIGSGAPFTDRGYTFFYILHGSHGLLLKKL